jgi:hypothetical protein
MANRLAMTGKFVLRLFLQILLITIFCSLASAQVLPAGTETRVEPEVDAHVNFVSPWRVLAFTGLEQGVGFAYQQWYTAAGLGYQLKPILKPHLENIDPDKEHHLVFGGGYEFLGTTQSGKTSDENRLGLDLLFHYRLSARFLLVNRNRVEFRWVDGVYATTYRNKLAIEHDFLVQGFRFTPYGSAEVFYNGAQSSWNLELYTAGIQWPYKHLLMLDTYYQRQNCTTCNPKNWNDAGVSLNFYFVKKKRGS